jgi:hypothetical protein
MLQIKYGVRQTDAAKMMRPGSRSVHKPATVIGSSIAGKYLSSGGVQHGFFEMEENGDKGADIPCDDDLERE